MAPLKALTCADCHPLVPLADSAGLVLFVRASCICTGDGLTILGSRSGVYVPKRKKRQAFSD